MFVRYHHSMTAYISACYVTRRKTGRHTAFLNIPAKKSCINMMR